MKFYLAGRLNMSFTEIAAGLITVAILLIADYFITNLRKIKKGIGKVDKILCQQIFAYFDYKYCYKKYFQLSIYKK